jgi:hypothetical protein
MAASSGPEIINDGLVLCVDGANQKNSAKGFKNLLNLSTWTLGTGGVTGFSINGTIAENQRVLDTGPFGVSTVVWDTPSNDVESEADGGWNSSLINIDPTKMYRFSVWMRRKTIGNGSYYLGCQGRNSADTNEGVLNRSNGSVNTNAYFIATTWPVAVSAGDWMLIVGHVWPAGSGTGSVHENTGLWTTSGTKLFPITDFVWQATNVKTIHRSYLYYSTDITTNQQWYQPRIDLCDGTEPSITELIAGVGSKWFDLSGNDNNGTFTNSPAPYNTSGYITFDGVDDYFNMTSNFNVAGVTSYSASFWINLNASTVNKDVRFFWHGNYGVLVYQNTANNLLFYLRTSVGTVQISTAYSTFRGVWTNICVTYDGSVMRLYVNGELKNSGNHSGGIINDTPTRFWLGGASTEFFTECNISNCLEYNTVLSAVEVQQNFNAMRSRYGI